MLMAMCKRKKEFFARKVKSLKTSDPRSWWSLVNKLAGKSSTDSELRDLSEISSEGGEVETEGGSQLFETQKREGS